jgi:hypothetical protein
MSLVFLSWCLLLPLANAGQPEPAQRARQWTAEEVLNWLPADTETVFVARGLFKAEELSDTEPASLEKLLQLWPAGSLFDEKVAKTPLLDEKITLAVEGSRRFRCPKGLGMMPYEGCSILVYDRDISGAREAFFTALAKAGATSLQASGQKVLVLRERLEQDDWKFFFTSYESNVLIIGTDEAYVTEVLKRMRDKVTKKRALPTDLPEWPQVDTKAQFWAVRHFRAKASDPSLYYTTNDLDATGVTFSFSPGGDKKARVRYLSKNPASLRICQDMWLHHGDAFKPEIREHSKGVIEISIDYRDAKAHLTFVFLLFAVLGHVVNV